MGRYRVSDEEVKNGLKMTHALGYAPQTLSSLCFCKHFVLCIYFFQKMGILTGGWVGCKVLNHAPLHGRDPPTTQDYSIYRNDSWRTVRGRAAYYEET